MNANDIMIWLLTSPLHGFASHNTMVLHIHGKKSGKLYHVPVNYVRRGDILYTVSSRDRTWWRNLRGGASLGLHLRGKNVQVYGTVIEEPFSVVDDLRSMLAEHPLMARILKVRRDDDGKLDENDLLRVAQERIVARFQMGIALYQQEA